MQAYLSQLILPIMAADLSAQHMYGVIMGVSMIASMAGLPIGAALMNRVRLSKLLLSATLFLVIGAVISATAPHILIYMVGSIVRGLAGSILAMTSIGAVALGLSGRARQLTLAFSSASWMVASVVGPTYAAWATHLLSWRWAMLLYLPLLIAARIVIAMNLKDNRQRKDAPFSYTSLVLIVVGVALTAVPATGILRGLLLIVGVTLLGCVTALLLPAGTFTQNTPRRAALAGMFFLTGSYFAANELISLTAHDLFDAGADTLGLILMGGGLGWAVTGVLCGMKPANTTNAYRLRSMIGIGLIFLTAIAISIGVLTRWYPNSPTTILLVVWTFAGIGMGLVYLDTINIFFEDPTTPDAISIEEMASSSVIVESLASTMFIPLTTSIVATAFSSAGGVSEAPYGLAWLVVAITAVFAFSYLRRTHPASAN